MAVGLVLNLIQITLDYFDARDSMEREVKALIETSHSPASQIAYIIDMRLADELLDGLLQHPAAIDARLIDNEGQTMSASSGSGIPGCFRWRPTWSGLRYRSAGHRWRPGAAAGRRGVHRPAACLCCRQSGTRGCGWFQSGL